MNPRTFWTDDMLDALSALGPDALRAARLAWDAGVRDSIGYQLGYEAAERDMAARWTAARNLILPVLKQPRHAEAEERGRPARPTPCPARCERCSRCYAAASWAARGGRAYQGAEVERIIAARTRGSAA